MCIEETHCRRGNCTSKPRPVLYQQVFISLNIQGLSILIFSIHSSAMLNVNTILILRRSWVTSMLLRHNGYTPVLLFKWLAALNVAYFFFPFEALSFLDICDIILNLFYSTWIIAPSSSSLKSPNTL